MLDILLQLGNKVLRGEPAAATARELLELLDRDVHRVELLERRPEAVEIPVLRIPILRRRRDISLDSRIDELTNLLLDVLALEHAAPLVIDHQSLTVEDVVILQDVLADLEVLRLDLGLR